MNRKALGIAFVAGVLICGLGCGVAFAQYSKFEYVGVKYIGDGKTESGTVESTLEADGKICVESYGVSESMELVADTNVPADKIYFDVVYNPERISLGVEKVIPTNEIAYIVKTVDENGNEITTEEYYDENEEDADRTMYYIGRWKNHDEVYDFFEIKDELLSDLKKKKIASYTDIIIESITVRVNPANADRVELDG